MKPIDWKIIILSYLRKFEMAIVLVLAVFMALVVLVSTIELCVNIITELSVPPFFQLGLNQLLEIFGLFLMILLGLELMETVKAYLREDVVHVEVVLIVAIIAIARKVIILDLKNLPGGVLVGLASIIGALAGGFFLLKKLYPTQNNQSSHGKNTPDD